MTRLRPVISTTRDVTRRTRSDRSSSRGRSLSITSGSHRCRPRDCTAWSRTSSLSSVRSETISCFVAGLRRAESSRSAWTRERSSLPARTSLRSARNSRTSEASPRASSAEAAAARTSFAPEAKSEARSPFVSAPSLPPSFTIIEGVTPSRRGSTSGCAMSSRSSSTATWGSSSINTSSARRALAPLVSSARISCACLSRAAGSPCSKPRIRSRCSPIVAAFRGSGTSRRTATSGASFESAASRGGLGAASCRTASVCRSGGATNCSPGSTSAAMAGALTE